LKPNAPGAVHPWFTAGAGMGHLLPALTIHTANIFIRKILTPACPVHWAVAGQLSEEKPGGENIFMAAATTPSAALLPGMKL